MKTIKQKARDYDEALARAKKIHKYSSDPAEIKRMEYIFPDLCESNDERIRKMIINHLEQERGSLSNDEAAEAISWLEQKSIETAWKPSEELDEASYHVGIKRVLDNPESYGLTKYNWKPSNEQLYFLHWLANNILTDGEVDKKASEILNTLYDDLKKL